MRTLIEINKDIVNAKANGDIVEVKKLEYEKSKNLYVKREYMGTNIMKIDYEYFEGLEDDIKKSYDRNEFDDIVIYLDDFLNDVKTVIDEQSINGCKIKIQQLIRMFVDLQKQNKSEMNKIIRKYIQEDKCCIGYKRTVLNRSKETKYIIKKLNAIKKYIIGLEYDLKHDESINQKLARLSSLKMAKDNLESKIKEEELLLVELRKKQKG